MALQEEKPEPRDNTVRSLIVSALRLERQRRTATEDGKHPHCTFSLWRLGCLCPKRSTASRRADRRAESDDRQQPRDRRAYRQARCRGQSRHVEEEASRSG